MLSERRRVLGALLPLLVGACAPEIERYRGLSGIDSALFALLVVELLRAPTPTNP